jgi:very-short-patch-repair endonuclease
VDGGQHVDNQYDEERSAWLRSMGYEVLRFWNPDVLLNAEGVAETILDALKARYRTLTPTLSRGAGEGA